MTVITIDTDREAELGIGTRWPFPKLQPDECLIAKVMADKYFIKVGDVAHINIYTGAHH